MDNLEYIDAYFTKEPSSAKKEEFERKITEDPVFAEEVSFYLSVKQLAGEQREKENKDRFKELYSQFKKDTDKRAGRKTIVQKLWPYVAAAAVITGIIFGLNSYFRLASPKAMAGNYIRENFQTLGVTMGNQEDSLQTALVLYNEGKLNESLSQFESISTRDSSSFEAKKYAGIVYLRLRQYDKAITCFLQLEKYIQLYANPAKFYQALALLERDQPGDKPQAKDLLQQVVQFDLEGKATATKLLAKW